MHSSQHPNTLAQCSGRASISPHPTRDAWCWTRGLQAPNPIRLCGAGWGGCNSLNAIRAIWYRKGGEGLQLPEFYGEGGVEGKLRGCSSPHPKIL